MTEGLTWGLPVIGYLFLAGVGAGAMTVSASMFLRGGDYGNSMHVDTARYGALLAPFPIIIGSGLLVLELGSFEVGNWFRFLNLYMVLNLSPMSIGTWLITATIGVSVVYAYTYLPNAPGITTEQRYKLRNVFSWLAIPLGISTAVYTGILLGAMPSRPFWNSPILALLFLVSALSTGIAAILLLRAIFHSGEMEHESERHIVHSGYLLTASDAMLIGFELMVIFLFIMYAHLTVGDVREAVSVLFTSTTLAPLFWFVIIVLGLIIPALIEIYYVVPKLLRHREFIVPRWVEIGVAILVLVGGFTLRYVVVVAGQITEPAGLHFFPTGLNFF